ncbi:MAG: biotin--[acetyl-CoA-carboxylase] ligase [Armatimonadetes bacterium]|nr:biotin--[acetyl-CoA-carboxylase] ligase [Armatimonadota bacterium]
MKLAAGILELQAVESTQDVAQRLLQEGDTEIGVVWALDQKAGRGRFQREWVSSPGDSLTLSFVLRDYSTLSEPWLAGMMVALAVAGAFHTQIRWPNDLTIKRKKVGGVLTELLTDKDGVRVPVVGVGVNLNQLAFPEPLDGIATSLKLERGHDVDPTEAMHKLVAAVRSMPEPTDWYVLQPIWQIFDDTPGKSYELATGEKAVALGVGSDGHLICAVEGETQSVMAADAIFSPHS